MDLANGSYEWYKRHTIWSRKAYKLSDTMMMMMMMMMMVVVVGAAIPTTLVIAPENATVPALLGAVVVVLTGMRAVFHWQDNYLRFSGAREAVEAQRRLYITRSAPYDDEATREQALAAAVTKVEQDEMRGWIEIAAKPPTP